MFLTFNKSVLEPDHVNQKGFHAFLQYTSRKIFLEICKNHFEKIRKYHVFYASQETILDNIS